MTKQMTNLRFDSVSEAKKMLDMLYQKSTMNIEDFLDTIELTGFSVRDTYEIYATLRQMNRK